MRDLKGKRVLVIGATGDMGGAIAEAFDQRNSRLFLHGHTEGTRLLELSERLRNVEGTCMADISQEEAVEAVLASLPESWGGCLDALLVCSGVNPTAATLESISVEDWSETIGVNLTGPFLCMKHSIPALRRSGGGKIVLISSIFAIESPTNRAAYSASKHGLTGLVQTASKELGVPPNAIHVNAICPGPVWGRNVEHIFREEAREKEMTVEEYSKSRFERIPAGRFLALDELANVALFLSSKSSNYMNGVLVKLTGGAIE